MRPNDKKIKEVYNKIAEGFYNLRQQPITHELEKLTEKWKPGLLLDIGCGIGNSTLPFAKKGFQCIGTDIAQKQIKSAKKYFEKHKTEAHFLVSEMQNLPFISGKFDYVISAAALHHLDSEEKRLICLDEMKRVLKKNGQIFLTVWKRAAEDQYVSWTSKGKKYPRYYHFFQEAELKFFFEKVGFRKIKIFKDQKEKNICVLAFK